MPPNIRLPDETEYELRKKRETTISWLEFIPVAAICTVSAVSFALTLKELIFEPGGSGGAIAPPYFGRSLNPISNGGEGYAYDITTCPSRFLELPMALYQASE